MSNIQSNSSPVKLPLQNLPQMCPFFTIFIAATLVQANIISHLDHKIISSPQSILYHSVNSRVLFVFLLEFDPAIFLIKISECWCNGEQWSHSEYILKA